MAIFNSYSICGCRILGSERWARLCLRWLDEPHPWMDMSLGWPPWPLQMIKKSHALWLFNIAMENDPFIYNIYLYIYIIIWYTWYTFLKWWFSMAMLNNQRVRKMMNSCWNGVPGRLSSDKSNMLIVVAVMLDDAWWDSFLNSSCTRKTRNRTKLNLPANKIKETCRMNVVF